MFDSQFENCARYTDDNDDIEHFHYENQTRKIAWSKVAEVVSTDGKLNLVSLGCQIS